MLPNFGTFWQLRFDTAKKMIKKMNIVSKYCTSLRMLALEKVLIFLLCLLLKELKHWKALLNVLLLVWARYFSATLLLLALYFSLTISRLTHLRFHNSKSTKYLGQLSRHVAAILEYGRGIFFYINSLFVAKYFMALVYENI